MTRKEDLGLLIRSLSSFTLGGGGQGVETHCDEGVEHGDGLLRV